MNNNNIQPDYACCSLYEYFEVLKMQEIEKRIKESLKRFNNIYKSLNEFSK